MYTHFGTPLPWLRTVKAEPQAAAAGGGEEAEEEDIFVMLCSLVLLYKLQYCFTSYVCICCYNMCLKGSRFIKGGCSGNRVQ